MNHLPRRQEKATPEKKRQSPRVRDAIVSVPSLASLFQELILFNRWDVLAVLEVGVSRPQVAHGLDHFDHIVVQDASQFLRVPTKLGGGVVEPPELVVQFPPALLMDYVVSELAKITPLRSVLPTGEAGKALFNVENAQVAPFLYGCSILCHGYGVIGLSCGNPRQDADWEIRQGLPPNAPLACRQQAILNLSSPSRPTLTGPDLLAHESSSSGNGSSPPAELGQRPPAL